MTCVASALAFALALSVAPRAHAYRTAGELPELESSEPVTWSNAALVTFDLAGGLPDGVEQVDLDRAFDDAVTTWAQINCNGPSPLLFWIIHEEHVPGDGINTLGFVAASELPGDVPDGTPAVTELQYERDVDGRWRIVEADIYLNAERDWTASEDDWTVDLATVLAHELGHVSGLLHPCELVAGGGAPACEDAHRAGLMFPLYFEEGTELSADDRDGLCFLYPEPRCREGDRGCVPFPEQTCADGGACADAGEPDAGQGDAGAELETCALEADAEMSSCAGDLEFASPCTRGEQCGSGLCVGFDSQASTCTRTCGGDAGACPAGFECRHVGGQDVCVGAESDSGCSLAIRSSRQRTGGLGVFAFLGALAALLRAVRVRERLRLHN